MACLNWITGQKTSKIPTFLLWIIIVLQCEKWFTKRCLKFELLRFKKCKIEKVFASKYPRGLAVSSFYFDLKKNDKNASFTPLIMKENTRYQAFCAPAAEVFECSLSGLFLNNNTLVICGFVLVYCQKLVVQFFLYEPRASFKLTKGSDISIHGDSGRHFSTWTTIVTPQTMANFSLRLPS